MRVDYRTFRDDTTRPCRPASKKINFSGFKEKHECENRILVSVECEMNIQLREQALKHFSDWRDTFKVWNINEQIVYKA